MQSLISFPIPGFQKLILINPEDSEHSDIYVQSMPPVLRFIIILCASCHFWMSIIRWRDHELNSSVCPEGFIKYIYRQDIYIRMDVDVH